MLISPFSLSPLYQLQAGSFFSLSHGFFPRSEKSAVPSLPSAEPHHPSPDRGNSSTTPPSPIAFPLGRFDEATLFPLG